MIVRNGAEGMDVQFRGTRMNSVWSGGKIVWPTWKAVDFWTWARYWDPEGTWNEEDWKVKTWDPTLFQNVITGWTLSRKSSGTDVSFTGGSDLTVRITATRFHDIVLVGRLEAYLLSNVFTLPAFDGWEYMQKETGAFSEGAMMWMTWVNGMSASFRIQAADATPAWSRSESRYRLQAYIYWGSLGSISAGRFKEGSIEGIGVKLQESFQLRGVQTLASGISGVYLGRNGKTYEPLNAGRPFALSGGQMWIPAQDGKTVLDGSMEPVDSLTEGFRDEVRYPGRRNWASNIISSASFTAGGIPYVADYTGGSLRVYRNPLRYSPETPLPYSLGKSDASWSYAYGIPMSEYYRLQEEDDG